MGLNPNCSKLLIPGESHIIHHILADIYGLTIVENRLLDLNQFVIAGEKNDPLYVGHITKDGISLNKIPHLSFPHINIIQP